MIFDLLCICYNINNINNVTKFQGFLPGVLGTSHGALQFMAYEELKKKYNIYRSMPPDTAFVSKKISCFLKFNVNNFIWSLDGNMMKQFF